MNVKIEDLKVTGFNSSWIFPDQSVWRISLCEMLIPKNTALLDIILICGQNWLFCMYGKLERNPN